MIEQSSLEPATLPPRTAIGERRDAPAPTATIAATPATAMPDGRGECASAVADGAAAPEVSGTTTAAAAFEEDGEIAPIGTDSANVPDESVTTTEPTP